MSRSKITLVGFYNYDNTLFDNITIPEQLDKDELIKKILIDSGEYPCIFTDLDFLKMSIENFFKIHNKTFQKWCNVLDMEYNPLENYDRIEDWTDNLNSGTSASTSSNSGGNTTSTNKISAYDSDVLHNNTSDTVVSTDNASASNTETRSDASTHSGRIHGNIGVTTSQQMLQSEWDVSKLNVYTSITEMFLNEFCIMVL